MNYRSVAREVGKGNIWPVYVLYGAEKYLIHEFIVYLTGKLVEEEHKDFAISTFDLTEMNVVEVVEDAETFPFMTPRKVIIAKDAQFLTSAKENTKLDHRTDRLLAYIQAPVDYAVLVLTVDAEKLDERKKIVKALKDKGYLIPFPQLKPEELVQWVVRHAQKVKLTFADGAAQHLILYAGTNLQTLSTEIEKLSLYLGAGGMVVHESIEELVFRSIEQNIFILIDDVVHLRMDKAFMIYYELLRQREDPIKILILLARQFRIILLVKEMARQGFSQQQMAAQLSLHPYAVKIAADQGITYQAKILESIISRLAELDYQMKRGNIDKVMGLELFLLQLIETR